MKRGCIAPPLPLSSVTSHLPELFARISRPQRTDRVCSLLSRRKSPRKRVKPVGRAALTMISATVSMAIVDAARANVSKLRVPRPCRASANCPPFSSTQLSQLYAFSPGLLAICCGAALRFRGELSRFGICRDSSRDSRIGRFSCGQVEIGPENSRALTGASALSWLPEDREAHTCFLNEPTALTVPRLGGFLVP